MSVDHTRGWSVKKQFFMVLAILALVAGMSSLVPSVYAAGKIQNPENENQWVSIGMGIRTEFVTQSNGSANGGSWSKDFGINNARLYINGGITKVIKFEFNTECFNCNSSVNGAGGNGTFVTPSGTGSQFGGNSNIGLLDAIGKLEFNQYVNIWVGRLLVPGERGELNGPFYHAVYDGFKTPLNQADFSGGFGTGGAGLYGRDNGAVFWGQVAPGYGHLQYSIGVFTGLQGGANQQSSLMYAGRLTYNFFNAEKNPGYYTSGTYYGTAGDILAIAVGVNQQSNGAGSVQNSSDFTAFISDLLFEKPLGNSGDKGVFTFNAEIKQYFANYNNSATTGSFAPGQTLPFNMFDGFSYTGYALYLFPHEIGMGRFQPYGRFTHIQPNESTNRQETEAGVNYVISGHNARISAFWQGGDLVTRGLNYAPNAPGNYENAVKVALQIQY